MAEVGDGAWTRDSLEAAGFVGWITFAALTNALTDVPQTGGVYVVIQAAGAEPECLNSNPGGRFKDRDPTVDAAVLEANWVDGAEVVYIGKADNLRRRLRQFGQFGAGKPVGHWGGRLIWQLARSNRAPRRLARDPGRGPEGGRDDDAGRLQGRLQPAPVRE